VENPPSPATDNLNETNMDTSYPTFETDKKPVKSSKGNRLRRSQIALGLGLTLFVLIVSALVGFLAYQNKKLKNLPPQVSSYDECANIEGSIIQESYPAICVTPDGRRFVQQLSEEEQKNLENQIDTSDWKTYRNEEYGFEFKYPTTILQQTNNGSQVNNKNIILAKFKTKDNKAIEVLFDYGSVFSIDYLKKYAPTGSEDLDPEKLIFGNNIFYYYGPGGGGVCYPDQFFHDYKGKIFILNFFGCENDKQPPESTKIIERQILSTFKFLDDGQVSTEVVVETPLPDSVVVSPLNVSGKINNSWLFEGQFTIELLDNEENEIAFAVANEVVPGSWLEHGMVDFTATLNFVTNAESGYLVFIKDNPSGLPEFDDSYEIPVLFE